MDKRKIKNKKAHFFSGELSNVIATKYNNGNLGNTSLQYGNYGTVQNKSGFNNASLDVSLNNTSNINSGNSSSGGGKSSFSPGGDFGISGTIGFVQGIKGTFDDLNQKADAYENQANNGQIFDLSKVNDYDTLQDYAKTVNPLEHVTTEDLTGNLGDRAKRYFNTSSQAAQAGMNYGPWGLLIGSIVGQVGAGLSDTIAQKKARKQRDKINNRIDFINNQNQAMLANKASNIMQNQLSEQQWNYIAALGGNLHSNSTTWSNGLNYIGAGGSHESNPNDGVAISTAPDGLENKVEEGEVVWDNEYVFSKRLKVPESIKKKNKWKGNTFADVAKELMENSEERPNDPIALRGLDDSLSRLRDSQDELKAKQEARKIKKEIASMPPEMLAQALQAQQPSEEEMAQQAAMEQQQMPMVDPSMQQPMMEQPPMYANGGHLFRPGGPSIKAVSGAGYFKNPIAQRELTGLNLDNSGNISTTHEYQTPEEVAAENQQNLLKYINRQTDYVNVRDAQRYGGFYNIDQINKREFLNGSTPMDVKNRAEGIGNQQDWENGIGYYNRYAVQENNKLNSLAASPKDIKFNENAYVLDKNNPESVNFFKKKNPNLNLDSDTIYFYSKNKNDVKDKNKFVNTNKISQEVYNKNNIDNIIEMSGINFNKLKNYSKGGHLYGTKGSINNKQMKKSLNEFLNGKREGSDAYKQWLITTNQADAPIARKAYYDYITNISKSQEPAPEPTVDFSFLDAEREPLSEKHFREAVKINNEAEARKTQESETPSKWSFDQTKLRYVPAIGSALGMLLSSRKPDYTNANEIARIGRGLGAQVSPKYIGDYLRYRPLDEAYYLNQLNAQQNAANNAIVGLSNGNRSMALASMLANDYNYNNQRGAAYRQGLEYNEAQRQRVGEFNRGTNQFNAQQYMQAAAQNAQNRNISAAYLAEAAKMREQMDSDRISAISGNMTNMFNSIGDIGRDYMNNKMTGSVYDYRTDTSGNVWYNGKKYVPAAKGGYLTIKTKNRRKE